MLAEGMTKTESITYCQTCGAALRDRDRFCRRCGVRRTSEIHVPTNPIHEAGSDHFETTSMSRQECRGKPKMRSLGPAAGSSDLRKPFSGPLIQVLTRELALRTSLLHRKRWTMHLVSALVTVPIWLMIVLLSPMDAYVAARAISSTFAVQGTRSNYAQDHDSQR